MGLYQGDLLLSKGGVDEAQINSKLEEFKNTLDINNIFIAVCGITTSAEIEAAYSENKWIFVNYDGRLCPLTTRSSATNHQFISNAGADALQLTCLNNKWFYNTITYANNIHGIAHAPGGSDPLIGYSQIATGSYTGTGVYGSDNRNSLTFNFVPKLVIIDDDRNSSTSSFSIFRCFSFPEDIVMTFGYIQFTTSDITYNEQRRAKLSGNTLEWYSTTSAVTQHNESAKTYSYIAIG